VHIDQSVTLSLYGEFTQNNTCQILLGSARFCLRYDKDHFGVFFAVHSVLV